MQTKNDRSMKKAILYTRVATDDQLHNYSQTSQEDELRKYCAAKGIEVVKHYHDCFSGKTFARPQFKLLFKYAKKNKADIDYLLVIKWDRFSRDIQKSITKIKEFKKLGIGVNATEQWIDHHVPDNFMLLAMLLSITELDKAKKTSPL